MAEALKINLDADSRKASILRDFDSLSSARSITQMRAYVQSIANKAHVMQVEFARTVDKISEDHMRALCVVAPSKMKVYIAELGQRQVKYQRMICGPQNVVEEDVRVTPRRNAPDPPVMTTGRMPRRKSDSIMSPN